jgi:hypothetical protein
MPKVDKDFDEAAKRWFKIQDDVAHEKRMELFRAGKLGPGETEQIIHDEVARGDAERSRKAAEEEKASRERGN